jgi:hypothetical protein
MRCRFCPQEITWIRSVNNKMVPVEAGSYMRDGADPLPPGRYFDSAGNFWRESDVPCKIEVWKSHWAGCPGADQARRTK